MFDNENTSGYTAAELAQLNASLTERLAGLDPASDEYAQMAKRHSERLLAEMDDLIALRWPILRYEVHAVVDPDCTMLEDDVLYASSFLDCVQQTLGQLDSYPYGVAILDTSNGAIDWGFGFGVAVPELAELTDDEIPA